jgi:hypothetical protein
VRDRIQIITLTALLSALTLVTLSLTLVLPWFNITFPLLLPILMSYVFYRLKLIGYLLYGMTLFFLAIIISVLGFETLIFYIIPSFVLGGILGFMLYKRFGWLDILFIFPWIHMATTFGSMIVLDTIFGLNLERFLDLLLITSTSKILGLYALSLLTTTLIIWFLVEDHQRLSLPLVHTMLPIQYRTTVFWILHISLVFLSVLFVELAALMFGPLLWMSIYLLSYYRQFQTSTLVLGLVYVLILLMSMVGLVTLWPALPVWLFIPTFLVPLIKQKSFNLD